MSKTIVVPVEVDADGGVNLMSLEALTFARRLRVGGLAPRRRRRPHGQAERRGGRPAR